jgi:MraZ protein
MLLGTFAPKLDEKGRVILPAKFWDEFQNGVVVTRGQERCLYVFSQREFESLHDRMREQVPALGKRGRDFIRMFLSGASQEVPDAQRRVTIPPPLRDYAHLDRDLTVLGVGTRVEIWDTESWTAYSREAEDDFSDADEGVIAGLF